MHSSRMCTARFSGRLLEGCRSGGGVSAWEGGVSLGGVCHPHPPVDRQTPVKILFCPKLRLRAVKWHTSQLELKCMCIKNHCSVTSIISQNFYVAENIVEPMQGKNKQYYYHRRYRRVPTIDECYTNDQTCRFEANEQMIRDK